MLGIGTWRFDVDTYLFHGPATMELRYERGEYWMLIYVRGLRHPLDYRIIRSERDGETLHLVWNSSLVPRSREISGDFTFTKDRCNGVVRIPVYGKLILRDGKRI